MAAKESSKSASSVSEAQLPAPRNFYGLAEHPNNSVFTSILKRKGRKLGMADECKKPCQQVEAYKLSADRLHQALMFMMVENPETSRLLVTAVKTEPGYRYAGVYLKTYASIQKQGRKGTYESLEPASKALESLDAEHERRVKKMLDVLKPLTKFIGDEYWEYARLRKVYWEAIEAFDDAITLQNKERTEQSEKATMTAQTVRNECKVKMLEFIKKAIVEQKSKHCECVLRFREESVVYHRSMAGLITFEVNEESVMKGPTK